MPINKQAAITCPTDLIRDEKVIIINEMKVLVALLMILCHNITFFISDMYNRYNVICRKGAGPSKNKDKLVIRYPIIAHIRYPYNVHITFKGIIIKI